MTLTTCCWVHLFEDDDVNGIGCLLRSKKDHSDTKNQNDADCPPLAHANHCFSEQCSVSRLHSLVVDGHSSRCVNKEKNETRWLVFFIFMVSYSVIIY